MRNDITNVYINERMCWFMNICQIREYDIADGPGVRAAIYVSGCTFKCPGCHNQEAHNFNYGEVYDVRKEAQVMNALYSHQVCGLSILGGEPLHPRNIETVLSLCRLVRMKFHHEKTIWLWTGYTAEEMLSTLEEYDKKHSLLVSDYCKRLHEILYACDVIVEGRYIESKRNLNLKFRGSSNQRIIKSRDLIDKKITIIPDEER